MWWLLNNFPALIFWLERTIALVKMTIYPEMNCFIIGLPRKGCALYYYNEILFLWENFSPLITGSISKELKTVSRAHIFKNDPLCFFFLFSLLLLICIFWPQLFTSLKANSKDLDVYLGFVFSLSRYLNRTFPWRKCFIRPRNLVRRELLFYRLIQ